MVPSVQLNTVGDTSTHSTSASSNTLVINNSRSSTSEEAVPEPAQSNEEVPISGGSILVATATNALRSVAFATFNYVFRYDADIDEQEYDDAVSETNISDQNCPIISNGTEQAKAVTSDQSSHTEDGVPVQLNDVSIHTEVVTRLHGLKV
jgi:hypothetical protein